MTAYIRYGGGELAFSSAVASAKVGETTDSASVDSATGVEVGRPAPTVVEEALSRVGSSPRSC